MPANARILAEEKDALRHEPVGLSPQQRDIVESAIREVRAVRKYGLHAVNARPNHIHSVVTCLCKPEVVMNSFKAYATRKLREAGLIDEEIKPWARHGSTPYLWSDEELARAIDYVLNGQGNEPFK